MIAKVENQFYNSVHLPMMLILSPEEKKAIANMGDDQAMIAFYPSDKGYTPELVNAWMRDGIQIQEAPAQRTIEPEYIPPTR